MSCPIADCPECAHFILGQLVLTCKAYPQGIPMKVYEQGHKNSKEECAPGFRFVPILEEDQA